MVERFMATACKAVRISYPWFESRSTQKTVGEKGDARLRCATLLGVQVAVATVQNAQFNATSENRGTLAKTLSKDYIPIQGTQA
jgi:hypothetical protein